MDCPNGCGKVERVDFPSHPPIGKNGSYIPPSAEYVCPECGWHAVWVRGKKLKVLFPGVGRGAPEEFLSSP